MVKLTSVTIDGYSELLGDPGHPLLHTLNCRLVLLVDHVACV